MLANLSEVTLTVTGRLRFRALLSSGFDLAEPAPLRRASGRQPRQSIVVAFRPTIFDRGVSALSKARRT
jgi:hypothetical protein